MTIEKTISLLAELKEGCDPDELQDHRSALDLGIEALKRIKYLQGVALYRTDTTLPGETKED